MAKAEARELVKFEVQNDTMTKEIASTQQLFDAVVKSFIGARH